MTIFDLREGGCDCGIPEVLPEIMVAICDIVDAAPLRAWDDPAHQREHVHILVFAIVVQLQFPSLVVLDVVVVLESLAVLHQREHRLEPHILHRVSLGQLQQQPRLHPFGTVK